MEKVKNITYNKEYRNYKINNGIKKDFGCYKKTLNQIIDQVEYESLNHSKALHVRLDIRNPIETDKTIERKDMTRILENTKRAIESKYKDAKNKPDLNWVWATEKEGIDEKPHFHLFASVNGNLIQNGYSIMSELNDSVKKFLKTENEGLVEYSESNGKYGVRVDRNSPDFQEKMAEAVYAGSYLAKINTKENRPKGARVSSASRLPEDWRKQKRSYKINEPAIEKNKIDDKDIIQPEEQGYLEYGYKECFDAPPDEAWNNKRRDDFDISCPPDSYEIDTDYE